MNLIFKSITIFFLVVLASSCQDEIADPDPGSLPVSDFIYQVQRNVPAGASYVAAVNFAATSKNASSYIWDFGNGTFAYTANAEGQYSEYGTYQVSLISVNRAGISTKTESIVVTGPPIPKAQFALSFDGVSNSLQVKIQNTSTDAARYEWDFGDGQTSTSSNPASHTFALPGSYRVGLTVYNADDSKINTFRTTVVVVDDRFLYGSTPSGKTWIFGTGTYLSPLSTVAQGTYYVIRGASIAYTSTLQSCELNDTYTFKPDGTYLNDNKSDARIVESGNECRAYAAQGPTLWKLNRMSLTGFQLTLGNSYIGDVKVADRGAVYDLVELKSTAMVLKYDRASTVQAGALETVVMVFYPQ
jgi:PKD repeat protein